MTDNKIGVYVHIPFCLSKCVYCDFNTFEQLERLIPDFVSAVCNELAYYGDKLGQQTQVDTVFYGGGTPSYIPTDQTRTIQHAIGAAFQITADAEVTLECNPDDITAANLGAWRSMGFNRLSLGTQSFNDTILKQMGRRHDSARARQAIELIRDSEFDNFSLDLIYGWPSQSLDDWRTTLEAALSYDPAHISLYSLQVEPTTPLRKHIETGRLRRPDDDLAADMYLLADELLPKQGLLNYEISNWAKPGRESRHNLKYWLVQPYLGVGPGAHSNISGERFSNLKSPAQYAKALAQPNSVVDQTEKVEGDAAMSEYMMLTMRLRDGVSEQDFNNQFGIQLNAKYGPQIDSLLDMGLVQRESQHLRLTTKGRLLGNEVFTAFF